MILNSQGISHLSRANHKRGIIIEIRTSHITIRLNHFRNSDILAKNNSKNAKNSVKIGKKQKKGPNGTTKGSLVRVRSIGVKLMKLMKFILVKKWIFIVNQPKVDPIYGSLDRKLNLARISVQNISVWGNYGSRSSVWWLISTLWYVAVYQVLKLLSDLMRMTFLKIVMNHYPTRHHEFITC